MEQKTFMQGLLAKYPTRINKNSSKPVIVMNENYQHAETPPGMNYELLPNQATIVAAVLNIEEGPAKYISSEKDIIYSTCKVITEPFGSGKTIIILAIILWSRIPKAIPEYNVYGIRNVSQIIRLYTNDNALIPCNLIFVGPAVFLQWVEEITQHTSLKFYAVSAYHQLEKLFQILLENNGSKYHIILVKNGLALTEPIITLISEFTTKNKKIWARLIIDDYNHSTIKSFVQIPPSLSQILVSTTPNKCKIFSKFVHKYGNSRDLHLHRVKHNNMIFSYFNLTNDINYVQKSIQIPKYKIYLVDVKDFYSRMINAIRAFGQKNTDLIAEMLESDSINTATKIVGEDVKSPGDILRILLSKQFEEYTALKRKFDIISDMLEKIQTFKIVEKGGVSYNLLVKMMEDYKKFEDGASIKKEVLEHFRSVQYDEVNRKLETIRETVKRISSNASEGGCQICYAELKRTNILKCCYIVVCELCLCAAACFREGGRQEYKGTCMNCHSALNISQVIYVDKQALENVEQVDLSELANTNNYSKKLGGISEKIKVVTAILAGEKRPEWSELTDACGYDIQGLIPGTYTAPQNSSQSSRKILIFANYEESITNISEELREAGQPSLILGGTVHQMLNIVTKFRKSDVNILLINSSNICSGLNLQFCNAVIFWHKMLNREVEAQLIGRAQRLGRQTELEIYYLQKSYKK